MTQHVTLYMCVTEVVITNLSPSPYKINYKILLILGWYHVMPKLRKNIFPFLINHVCRRILHCYIFCSTHTVNWVPSFIFIWLAGCLFRDQFLYPTFFYLLPENLTKYIICMIYKWMLKLVNFLMFFSIKAVSGKIVMRKYILNDSNFNSMRLSINL